MAAGITIRMHRTSPYALAAAHASCQRPRAAQAVSGTSEHIAKTARMNQRSFM